MIHNVILLGVIFVLLQISNLTELLSFISRPMITQTAAIFGIDAVNRGSEIVLGELVLPWSQDCSGVNSLVILWGVTLWAERERKFDKGLVVRLLLCIPAALISNMLRIFTLAGYRYLFYPAWESEELHYLVGFLWLIPFLFLFINNSRGMNLARWIEILHLSLVLSLIAPLIFSPGGSVVALSALVYLAYSRVSNATNKRLRIAYLAWGIAAVLIALSDMESLWIAWLLLCPRLAPWPLIVSWTGVIILSGTIPVLAMHMEWQVIVGLAIVYRLYLLISNKKSTSICPIVNPAPSEVALLTLLGMAPFALSASIGISHQVELPPAGLMSRQLTSNNYQLMMTGQPSDVRMYWYGAFGDGRHHSLASCMRFRGLIMEPVQGQHEVLTGGRMWMRDFYLHDGKLIESYGDYLLASFSPFSSPGVHLILDAPSDSMSAAYFSRTSERLAKRIFNSYLEQKTQSKNAFRSPIAISSVLRI